MLTEKSFDTGTVSINYAESPAGGVPLVLLHGITGRWQGFLPILPSLSFRYHTYSLDLRGHGRSGRAPGAYQIVDYAEDVIQLLRAKMTVPAVLLGHSLGADVAIRVAAEAPALIEAVILEDPAPYLFPAERFEEQPIYHVFAAWRELAGPIPAPNDRLSQLQAMDPTADEASLRARAKSLSQVDPDVLTTAMENRIAEPFSSDTLLPKITAPVLLLQGNPELGGLLSTQDAERVLAFLVHCTHVRCPEDGHDLHSRQPVAFCQIINNFLESL